MAELAADRDRDTAQIEAGQPRHPIEHRRRAIDRHAELVFLAAGGDFGVGARIDIGIDAQHRARGHPLRRGDLGEDAAFLLKLEVELADPGVEPAPPFVPGLADARNDELAPGPSGRPRARTLTAPPATATINLLRPPPPHP